VLSLTVAVTVYGSRFFNPRPKLSSAKAVDMKALANVTA